MKTSVLIFFISFATLQLRSQETKLLFMNSGVDSDSLEGFNEALTKQKALAVGCLGEEYNVFMYYAKRSFIKTKYKLVNPTSVLRTNQTVGIMASGNEDFEASPTANITSHNQVAGWIVTSGSNQSSGSSCSLTSESVCCVGQPYATQILQNGYVDLTIGSQYPIFSVFGSGQNLGDTVGLNASLGQMFGNRFIKINDAQPNFGVHRLTKKILVDSTNALFQFAFIVVIYPAHECCEAPAFQVSIKNLTASTASNCPSFSFAPGPNCVFSSPNTYFEGGTVKTATLTNGKAVYSPWTKRNIDLRPFTGDSIQIDFIMSDCVFGAHQGLAYLDAQCGPMNVLSDTPPGVQSICLASGSATISAVPGFTPYQWSGPGGFSSNTQSITVTTPGNYSLTLGEPCLRTTHVVPVIPIPTVAATPFYYLCSGNATLNASGATTYTWLPDNLNGSQFTPSPTTTTTYTVVGANLSCTNSAVSTVSVGTAPPLTLISDVQLACRNTCITFSSTSTDFNPITYDWGDGSPVVGLTTTHCYSVSGTYSVSAVATYSSGCKVISSGVSTVTILPNPTAGINIVGGNSQPINTPITFNNTSVGANYYNWTFNDSLQALSTALPLDVVHTYTSYGAHCVKLIAIDTILGCKDSTDICLVVPCLSQISFPDVFTPNGDDVNEVFKFPNVCIKELECVIYDRWGLKIYDWNKVNGGWDGRTIAGVAVSDGTYFYVLRYIDSADKECYKSGTITLFR